jgi:ribosomal protein S27E
MIGKKVYRKVKCPFCGKKQIILWSDTQVKRCENHECDKMFDVQLKGGYHGEAL